MSDDPESTIRTEEAKTAPPSENLPAEPEPAEEDDSAKMQQDLDRFRDLAMRSRADFDNFRKRATREKEDAVKFANANFLDRLIPIIDNFELGLAAAKTGAENSPILSGMSMVAKQLTDFLADSGVTAIEAEGQKFDPNVHEAIGQEESDKIPEGHIVRQVRKGFKLKERLLRPANVIVSKGKPAAED
ncbi:MAG: molecular chaperone GrpE [Chthoniobacter sp.]|jgi:molecular chaperone GrpE|nr:molecular chaperone GrpE [Chthoniobacter sp.]